MTPLQLVVGHAGNVACAAALLGLIVRHRASSCRSFTAYLSFMFVADTLVLFAPGHFWNWRFWLFKQTVFDLLELAIALELAHRVFLGFPGAAQTARGTLFLFLVGTLAAVLPLGQLGPSNGTLIGPLRPRLELGVAWTFTAMAAIVRWYDLPLRRFHWAIMLGLVIHLCLFGSILSLIQDHGWAEPLALSAPFAFVIIVSWWAVSAWRTESEAELALEELVAPLRRRSQ